MSTRRRVWLGGLAAMVALGVLAVVSFTGPSGLWTRSSAAGASGRSGDPSIQARLGAVRRVPGDPLALGRVDAPVVVAEWGDFQCPFCRAFTLDTEPALVSQYVESGQVRLEWHDFAYLGPESVLAARGARAAGRQGKFWEFHDTLYRNQPPENSGALTEASLAETARGLGLDPARFAGDFADPAIAAEVDRDQGDGARLGVTGVPSFLINGQLVVGAQPVAAFRQVIDGALARVR